MLEYKTQHFYITACHVLHTFVNIFNKTSYSKWVNYEIMFIQMSGE